MQNMRPSHYRWVVASLVFFITLVNFIDRSAISFVIEPLKQEFHFTDTQFGMILSAFAVGYVLLTAFGGWLVDVWGSRIVWALAGNQLVLMRWALRPGCRLLELYRPPLPLRDHGRPPLPCHDKDH